MWAFDASSMIYAWDNYPFKQFPGLWKWLGDQISSGWIVIPLAAYEETLHKTPECGNWLNTVGISVLHPNTSILTTATSIKTTLGIIGDRYGNGVGENDLIIIATAHTHGIGLVSNEKLQITPPKVMANFKIPAVCGMRIPPMECIDFLEFMKRSNSIF